MVKFYPKHLPRFVPSNVPELRKIKVVENCDEPFKKENKTYYVRNNKEKEFLSAWFYGFKID